MNGQGVIALAFLLAVVSQAQGQGRGVSGGLSEQQMAGPGSKDQNLFLSLALSKNLR